MRITVVCPRCESSYQVEANLRGKRMRCPNAICRAIIEIPGEVPPAPKPPIVAPAPDWAKLPPPPVRAAARVEIPPAEEEPAFDIPGDEPADEPPPTPEPELPQPRRRSLLIIGILLAVLAIGASVGVWRWTSMHGAHEEEMARAAEKSLREQEFLAASQNYQQLVRTFPASPRLGEYRFLAELSDVRADVEQPRDAIEDLYASLKRVETFVSGHQETPILEQHHADVWTMFHHLAETLAGRAEEKNELEPMMVARHAWAQAQKFKAPPGKDVAKLSERFQARAAEVTRLAALRAERVQFLTQLADWIGEPRLEHLLDAKKISVERDYAQDVEVQSKLAELQKSYRDSLHFVRAPSEKHVLAVDPFPSLAWTPAVGATTPIPEASGTVLALARGVLYAFDPAQGNLRWVCRLGIDTVRLPVRVPADDLAPARYLALSSDLQAVLALDEMTGELLWSQALAGVCLGPPVHAGRSLLVPTWAGRIDEIDVAAGVLRGSYPIDQPLPLGGVRLGTTSRVFFAGQRECVYEIDVAQRQCVAVHYTGHADGAWLAPPIPFAHPARPQETLLLTTGRDLKVQAISLADLKALEPAAALPGVNAFPPWIDAGRVILANDEGRVGVWGRQLPGTLDALFYPILKAPHALGGKFRQSTFIAHVDEDRLWILAAGKLHALRLDVIAQTLTPVGKQIANLGSPLHEGQMIRANGKRFLFLALQDDGGDCRLAAIDADSGEIHWQRRLGLTPAGDGVALSDRVVIPEARRVQVLRTDVTKPWTFLDDVGVPLDEERQHLWIRRGDDVVHIAAGKTQVTLQTGAEKPRTVELPAERLGAVVTGPGLVLVPLRSGQVLAIPWDGEPGPPVALRSAGAEGALRLASISADRFAVSDGKMVQLVQGANLEKVGSAAVAGELLALADESARVIVVDAANIATLLEGDRLLRKRSWPLGGKLQGQPFRLPGGFGCVVDRKRLVAFDAEKPGVRWEYAMPGEVVGTPLVVGQAVIVADEAGQVLALDSATGMPLAPGISFRANVAAAASPLLWRNHVLVPLTDGTCFALPAARLKVGS